jgi:hypothetical protein
VSPIQLTLLAPTGDASGSSRNPALLADLVGDRRATRALTGLLIASLAATAAGPGGWRCPLLSALGIPCPGCGLSRGALELLAGDLGAALAAHPLAPLGLAVTLVLVAASLLPAAAQRRLTLAVRRVEAAGPFDLLFAGALLTVWAVRLASPSGVLSSLVPFPY